MSRFTLQSILDSGHGMNAAQLDALRAAADSIAARYPGPDSGPYQEAALQAAYQATLLADGVGVLTALRGEVTRAEDNLRWAEQKVGTTVAAMQQAARTLHQAGKLTLNELAEHTGQDATVVQTWLQ